MQCGHLSDGEELDLRVLAWRRDQHRGQKRGDGLVLGLNRPEGGEGYIITTTMACVVSSPVAPVHETDVVLLPIV